MLYSDNVKIINARLTISMIFYNYYETLRSTESIWSYFEKSMSRLFLRLFEFKVSTLGL